MGREAVFSPGYGLDQCYADWDSTREPIDRNDGFSTKPSALINPQGGGGAKVVKGAYVSQILPYSNIIGINRNLSV